MGHGLQRACEDIGYGQIKRYVVAETTVIESGRGNRFDKLSHTIFAGIFTRDPGGNRINVGCKNRNVCSLGDCYRQNAASAAKIQCVARFLSFELAVYHRKAPGSGAVVARAERHSGIDADGMFMGCRASCVMGTVNDEPSGADWSEIGKGLFDPVFIIEFFCLYGAKIAIVREQIGKAAFGAFEVVTPDIDGQCPQGLCLIGFKTGYRKTVILEQCLNSGRKAVGDLLTCFKVQSVLGHGVLFKGQNRLKGKAGRAGYHDGVLVSTFGFVSALGVKTRRMASSGGSISSLFELKTNSPPGLTQKSMRASSAICSK